MPRIAKAASNVPLLGDAKAMWGSSLRAANKADKTIRTYLDAVGKLEGQVTSLRPIDRISRADHEAMIAGLYEAGWKPSSVSTVYRSLRSFCPLSPWFFIQRRILTSSLRRSTPSAG